MKHKAMTSLSPRKSANRICRMCRSRSPPSAPKSSISCRSVNLPDVVKFLPSVTIQQGGPGFAQVYFRGVSSGENANHSASLPTVGTYLDEMPITTIQGALDFTHMISLV